jgi:thiol-disulfide isomerase/thioredoxin
MTDPAPKPLELKKKKSITDEIIVRDIYTKEEYPLSRIVNHGIVFIELSASWCKACPEMKETTAKLVSYFGNRVSFIRLYLENDIQEDREYRDVIPEMAIVSSPDVLALEKTDAMPRVIVLSSSGSEVAADITGVYPILYYYGLLSDL